ncbi:DUF6463 family protein [Olivibacter domesticus]|uniref:Uncharacterized protein n=1 Tax=Olivibacter domesticus TaxID=407022 RepID=A0A1H7GB71_OLID1|nr:DUF6463 family protein [Olivibacter domesticus]SEK35371.1 hypothetical protein SAMN05661044_00035 [Olivibacter domesticus]
MNNQALFSQQEPLTAKAARLYKWAGWMLVSICLLHFVFWSVVSYHSWGAWISGALWDHVDPETLAAFELNFEFWALPGSFMIPLLLLGLLITRAAQMRDRLPRYLGWSLLLWVLICSIILEPSGFPLGLIPAVMLIMAHKK